jgi:hypothetical protein
VFTFSYALEPIDWIYLKGNLTCNSLQVNYVFMKTVVPDLSLNEDYLFHEFSCVQKYCESKLKVWNEKMTKMENWPEMLAQGVLKCCQC